MGCAVSRVIILIAAATVLLCGCSSEQNTATPKKEAVAEASPSPLTIVTGKRKLPTKSNAATTQTPEQPRTSRQRLDSNTVRVHGKVIREDGSSASGAVVSLMRHRSGIGRSETITSAAVSSNGNYELSAENDYPLAILLKGDFPDTYVLLDHGRLYSPKPGPREIQQDVTIPESHNLQGRVISADGQPLPNIAVHLTPSFGRTPEQNKNDTRSRKFSLTTSTAEGQFAFPHLSKGLWIVGAKVDGWAAVSLPVQVPAAEPIIIKLGSKGGTVTGQVLHKQTGESLGGVTVSAVSGDMNQLVELETQETESHANGTFTISNLSTGPLRLIAKTDDDRKLWMTPPSPAPLRLQDGQTTAATIYMYPGHTITGKVYDKDTGEPLPGATLSPLSQGREPKVVTDQEGQFRFENISNQGTMGATIDIKLDGYQLAAEQSSGNGSSVYAKLPEDGSAVHLDLPMRKMVEVRGRVVTEDEMPVSHAKVKLFGRGQVQSVDTNGAFTVYVPPFSQGTVEANADGFAKQMVGPIEVSNQSVENVKIVMRLPAALHGRVVDSAGKPVEGADIHVTRWHGAGTGSGGSDGKSGREGEFTISDLPEKVDLHAEKEGYSRSEKQSLTMKPGEARTGVELVLRDDAKHSISGIVVWSADGSPVAGADVSEFPSAGLSSITTEQDGRFKLDGLPEGAYDLQVMYPRRTIVRGIKSGTHNLRIEIESGEVVKPTVTLIGTVVDDISGRVVPDFLVEVPPRWPQVEKLDEPGRFRINGLSEQAIYALTLSSPAHEKQKHDTTPGKDGETIEQTFRLTTPGAISGRVVNKGSNEPVPDLTIVNYGVGYNWGGISGRQVKHTTTDNEGNFTLAPAPVGKNQLKVLAPEPYADVAFEAEVKSGEVTSVDDVLIGGGATIEGQVVRGDHEEPVSGVEIYVTRSETNYREQTTADTDGRFKMVGLSPGHYSVRAEGASTHLELKDSEVANVKLHVGTITVRGIVTRGGVPILADVYAKSANGQTISGSNSRGQFEIQNLRPGIYTFHINLPEGNQVKESVTIPDQPEVEKNFALPDGRLLVRVTNQNGKPIQGHHIIIESPALAGPHGTTMLRSRDSTGADGTYMFSGLASGNYTVKTASGPNDGTSQQTVAVADGETREVQLQVMVFTDAPPTPAP